MDLEQCMWCKAKLAVVEGPTHKYMESTASCWAAFGRVLAREYSEPELIEVHRLTVDSYAVQHPGRPSRQSIQSVAVHLIRLCLFVEQGLESGMANDAMLEAAKRKSHYHWLEPPGSMGRLTVADVDGATSTSDHKELVREWAGQMWSVWSPHHEIVRHWAAMQ